MPALAVGEEKQVVKRVPCVYTGWLTDDTPDSTSQTGFARCFILTSVTRLVANVTAGNPGRVGGKSGRCLQRLFCRCHENFSCAYSPLPTQDGSPGPAGREREERKGGRDEKNLLPLVGISPLHTHPNYTPVTRLPPTSPVPLPSRSLCTSLAQQKTCFKV